MGHILLIAAIIGGVVVVLAVVVLIAAVRFNQKMANLPPHPVLRCAKCASDAIQVMSSGLWDEWDDAGRHTGGIFQSGICKRCPSRRGRNEDTHSYVPSDEEWEGHFAPIERDRKLRENWPFSPEDDFYARKARLKGDTCSDGMVAAENREVLAKSKRWW